MKKSEILSFISSNVFVPVLRADSSDMARKISEAIFAGGLRSVEVTKTVPNALSVIDELSAKYNEDFLVGAGTVLDVDFANSCINAGAKFIVTPCLVPEVIEFCNQSSIPVFAGAFTPTEVNYAWKLGADVVKLFPASVGGASYLKALKGPFPDIEIMPTGGVSLSTAESFYDAGAFALGVGGELVNPESHSEFAKLKKVESLSREFALLAEKLQA